MSTYKDVDPLLREIKDFKKMVAKSCNADYMIGYTSALSLVEGIVAGLPTLDRENAERCVACDEIIPEGRQVCPSCENATPKQKN